MPLENVLRARGIMAGCTAFLKVAFIGLVLGAVGGWFLAWVTVHSLSPCDYADSSTGCDERDTYRYFFGICAGALLCTIVAPLSVWLVTRGWLERGQQNDAADASRG